MQLSFLNKIFKFLILILVCSNFNGKVSAFLYQNVDTSPSILILLNLKDQGSVEFSDQVIKSLRYAEFPSKTFDFSKKLVFKIPLGTKLIVNTTESITSLKASEIKQLVEFVASGGNMIFLGVITEEAFSYLQGIKPGVDFAYTKEIRGIKAVENIFPGFKNMSFYSRTSVPHNGIEAENFSQQVRVLATAFSDETYPLILENRIGFGSVLIFNTSVLYEKQYRGIVFSGILKSLPNLPYRVANVGTMFLDDFPAPLYNIKLEPIASEYDVDQAEFVTNIWWPDMKAFADSVFMTYTAMTVFNYNANIVPPFDYHEWEFARLQTNGKEIKPSIELTKDVITTRHELGFHGYNHFSLTNKEWENNQDFMISSLRSVQKRWRIDDLGKLPVTYVPPTNYIDSTGVQAVAKGLPSIKIMSSLYLGYVEDGGGREFEYDPYNSKFFDYPRISSGFNMDGNSIFNQHSMQILTGVWNHFVHPDDVFQIVQSEVDDFESRNPDNLGWRSSVDTSTSLYKEFVKRISYTKKQYPFIRLVSADYGAKITQDWLATNSNYSEDKENYIVNITPPAKYISSSPNKDDKYWFMYVTSEEKTTIERYISNTTDGYSFSKFWDGYLFQFYSKSNLIKIPKPKNFTKSSKEIQSNINLAKQRNTTYLSSPFYEVLAINKSVPSISIEKQLNMAIESYLKNPKNLKLQEELIALSLENDQNIRAIMILEFRLKSNPIWKKNDLDRLITYYGFESAFNRAENYLEELWRKYGDEKVILLKDRIVEQLGLSSIAFVKRWKLREIDVYGISNETVLAYTSAIESQETWPEVKQKLRELIKENPRSDSLYAYTIQRSFYYESSDSTIALLEEFPDWSHTQLSAFATQFANIYGFEIFDYDKALYWAGKSIDISNRSKLEWIAQKNEMDRFYKTSKEFLESPQVDDSLRVYAGTTLYYLGYKERGLEIMYSLFKKGKRTDTEAHTLINEEFKYITYQDKKNLFLTYPDFFNEKEVEIFKTDLRWNEGLRGSIFGEYFSDNFDNQSARVGASVQFGNRRNRTHLFKLEDIYVNNSVGGQNFFSNFTGIGYEYEKRKEDYSRVFRFGPSLFFGDEGLLGEAFISYSISYDSSFTALNLSLEPEFTQQSIVQDIYKVKGEVYREDPWFRNKFLTTLSGNTQFYTNNVVDYSVTGRAYLQPWGTPFRGRLIGELGWQDASESFTNANPFFTQNKYFLQGLGFDVRYRNPNNFDYHSLLELELMGKHGGTDGYFITGRANIEHKFKRFWQIKIGTEFSTSSVYQSNRIFFTISHFFHKKLRHPKQK